MKVAFRAQAEAVFACKKFKTLLGSCIAVVALATGGGCGEDKIQVIDPPTTVLCGNGVLDKGEACDPGIQDVPCRADCTLPQCGDGMKDEGEECDDGAEVLDESVWSSSTKPESSANGNYALLLGYNTASLDQNGPKVGLSVRCIMESAYQDCSAGHFGENCGECTCKHGICKEGRDGDGQCSSCDAGWDGPNCDQCASGWLGANCDIEKKCSVHGELNPETGHCISGSCEERFAGRDCDECSGKWTGANCNVCNGGYGDNCAEFDSITDGEGNKYNIVGIGNHVWTAENMAMGSNPDKIDLTLCRRNLHRVICIDTVHLCRLHHHVGLDLQRTKAGRGIGGEVRAAGAAAKNNNPAFFEMADCPLPVEWLGHVLHGDGGHDPRLGTLTAQRILKRQRIDDRGQHAHRVTARPVNALRCAGHPPEDISAADDDARLHAQPGNFGDLRGDAVDGAAVDGRSRLAHQCFAGKFEKNARIAR